MEVWDDLLAFKRKNNSAGKPWNLAAVNKMEMEKSCLFEFGSKEVSMLSKV